MGDAIVTLDKPSTSSHEIRVICRVCKRQFSQYTCPRCNSRYCSLQCYKGHSLHCTESFMRENVMEELHQVKPDDGDRQRMLEILKRFYSEEQSEAVDIMDEDGSMLSEKTIQKILSGDCIGLDDLSMEETKQFQRAVASGELSKMIEPWNPWWLKPLAHTISLSSEGTRLVTPVCDQDLSDSTITNTQNCESEIPVGPETPLMPLNKMSNIEPSPLLPVHLVDIIYSYCFTLRFYNGDYQSDSLGACIVMFSISSVLGEESPPETIAESIANCLEQTCSPTYRNAGGLKFGLGLVDDVIKLLSLGETALICSLSDLQRLIKHGKSELKSEKMRKDKKGEISRKMKLADRKLYFMMCWIHEKPKDYWSTLSHSVTLEKISMVAFDPSKNLGKVSGDKESKGKVLIEEIR